MEMLRMFIVKTKTDSLKKINLLPFHRIGSTKYKKFNIPYKMGSIKPPGLERMKELKEFFSETGVKVKIGG
jgi:pyruvate formate lyase activating enzyme